MNIAIEQLGSYRLDL